MITRMFAALGVAASCAIGSIASAVPIYGITMQNNLFRIDSASPTTVQSAVFVTGLQSNEVITGIDFRPATGQLYGVGSSSRLYTINATVDGWITEASSVVTGTFVKKHQVLGSFYSPEFLSAEQAMLFALSSDDRVRSTGRENPAQKDQLVQYGINIQPEYRDVKFL